MSTTVFVAQNVYWRGDDVESSTPDYVCAEFDTFDAAHSHGIGRVGQPAPPDSIPDGIFETHYEVSEYLALSKVEYVEVRRWIYDGARLQETLEGADL